MTKTKEKTEAAPDVTRTNEKVVVVKVEGIAPLMCDAVRGGRTPRPEQPDPGKLPEKADFTHVENLFYYPPGEDHIVFPATNIEAFFTNSKSGAIVLLLDKAGAKKIAKKNTARIFAEPQFPPITHNGEKIVPSGFDENGLDKKAGLTADGYHLLMAIQEKAMNDNQKFMITTRPFVQLPWEIEFTLRIYEGADLTVDTVEGWLRRGGFEVGLGNHRPRYGRFRVTKFEVIEE